MTIGNDTEEHLRRNTLLVAAGILLSAWLNIELGPNTQVFFGLISFKEAEPKKVVVAVLALQLYTFFRYHFSEARQKQFAAYRDDHKARLYALASRIIAKAQAKIENTVRRSQKSKFPSIGWKDVTVKELTLFQDGGTSYRYELSDDSHEDRVHRYAYQHGETSNYHLNTTTRIGMYLRAHARTAYYSRGTFELVIPYVLSCYSMIVCIARLLPAYWYDLLSPVLP